MQIEVVVSKNRYIKTYGHWAPLVLRRAARFFGGRKKADVSVSLIGDAKMRAMNRQYRGKDKTTNVLAFCVNGEGLIKREVDDLGDILISIPEVEREARLYGWTREYAFARLLVHGFLHLLGHDHEKEGEAGRMEAMERKLLKIYKPNQK